MRWRILKRNCREVERGQSGVSDSYSQIIGVDGRARPAGHWLLLFWWLLAPVRQRERSGWKLHSWGTLSDERYDTTGPGFLLCPASTSCFAIFSFSFFPFPELRPSLSPSRFLLRGTLNTFVLSTFVSFATSSNRLLYSNCITLTRSTRHFHTLSHDREIHF